MALAAQRSLQRTSSLVRRTSALCVRHAWPNGDGAHDPMLYHRVSSSSSKRYQSNVAPSGYRERAISSTLCTEIARSHGLPLFKIPEWRVISIEDPSDFYKRLCTIISRAEKRIYLASLYIGKTEYDLIDQLCIALERKPQLRLIILVDKLRATREGQYTGTHESESCASLLAALQARFPDQVEVRAFRASGLPNWLEKLLGKRLVEGYGLQHMKLYGNDGDLMVSGANLSNDYFTNRRDRYVWIRDRNMSEYAFDVLSAVAKYSFSLQAVQQPNTSVGTEAAASASRSAAARHYAYETIWDDGRRLLPSQVDMAKTGPRRWKRHMQLDIEQVTNYWRGKTDALALGIDQAIPSGDIVRVIPLLQMGPIGVRHETTCIPLLLEAASAPGQRDSVHFTTGYFSLNPLYAKWILDGQFRGKILTAAPEANGFYGSKGISRHLPAAYTWLESRFYRALVQRKRHKNVRMYEWSKPGWTYHAKGIWIGYDRLGPQQLSLLGSSNFGIRSAKLDLECTLLLDATQSKAMRKRLAIEAQNLFRNATVTGIGPDLFQRPERKVHWGVKIAAWCIQRML